mmetsp:Transcript_10855/g.34953  ORF Transcript_10855/g.34953 Transcript_10855/m.34953 type:complete len:515 (-) Transcript_10855:38-1582(-)|eukprot:scaffold77_cov116-Isochrysis_galbana.AAC.14
MLGLLGGRLLAVPRPRRLKVARAIAHGGGSAAQTRALDEGGVDEHQRSHALDERRRPRQNARVVPPLGLERDCIARQRRCLLRLPNRRHTLDGNLEIDGRAGADTTQGAARVVAADGERRGVRRPSRSAGDEGVVVRGAAHEGAPKSGADFESLCGRQRHHRVGQLGLETIEDGLAQACGNAGAHAGHRPADGVLLQLDLPDQCRHAAGSRRVGAPEREQLLGSPLSEVEPIGRRHQLALPIVDDSLPVLVTRQRLERSLRPSGGADAARARLLEPRSRGARVHANQLEEVLLRRNLGGDVSRLALGIVGLVPLSPDPERRRVAQHAQRALLVHLRACPAKGTALACRHCRLGHRHVADGRDPARDVRAVGDRQPLLGDGAGRDAPDGLAGRRAPATRRRLVAILEQIGQVGVTRPRDVAHLLVVPRALVLVGNKQPNRSAQGVAVLGAGHDRHQVLLFPRRREPRLAGTSATELRLDVSLGEGEAGRAAVHDGADALAMRLAKGADAEEGPER